MTKERDTAQAKVDMLEAGLTESDLASAVKTSIPLSLQTSEECLNSGSRFPPILTPQTMGLGLYQHPF